MNFFEESIGFILAAILIIAISLGVYWVLWLLWCWVLPQLYASGPAGLLAPGFWLFAACAFLLKVITTIFGFRRK